MATDRKNTAELDKQRIKTLQKLKEAGIDTRKKLDKLTGRDMYENPVLRGEMGNIFLLQDSLKMRKEYDWIMDGTDEEPADKEADKYAQNDRYSGSDNYSG